MRIDEGFHSVTRSEEEAAVQSWCPCGKGLSIRCNVDDFFW